MVGRDRIVTACYDNISHMDSSRMFVVLMSWAKNILTSPAAIFTGFTW